MTYQNTREEKSRHSPLRIETAVEKLLDTSKLIICREGVKPSEGKRIQHAFKLLENPPTGTVHRAREREYYYRQFLKQVNKTGGRQLVVLCAVGLGQSSIASMRDRDRLLLPGELGKLEDAYKQDVLRDIVSAFSAKETRPPSHAQESLTGEVYELTVMDAQNMVMSEHLRGKIYLTNTYSRTSQPFITIPISRELSLQFAAQRHQVM